MVSYLNVLCALRGEQAHRKEWHGVRKFWLSIFCGLLLILSACYSHAPNSSSVQQTEQSQARTKAVREWLIEPKETPFALRALPRDRSYAGDHYYVDWVKAVKEGAIAPKGSIDGNTNGGDKVFDLDVIFVTEDPFLSDVLFSHSSHTYWLNCESCHPRIFVPKKQGNYFTMRDIWNGEYCGRCHGTVAFPVAIGRGGDFLSNCLKCHHRNKKGTRPPQETGW